MKSYLAVGSVIFALCTATGGCLEDNVAVGSESDGGGTTTSCTSNSECGLNEACAYLEKDACTAKGACVAQAALTCQAYSAGCACDGTEINIACNGLPTGYETKPLAHTGGCTTPVTDAGTGTACTTSADCPSGGVCGFAEADACKATGTCFPAPGVICNAYLAGCACDNTEINIACNGLPTGYETKPLQYAHACNSPLTDASTGTCVTIDVTSYTTSCTQNSDCVSIATGTLCDGNCGCTGGAAINVSSQAAYQQAISGLTFGLCPCPAEFPPVCTAGVCAPGNGLAADASVTPGG